MEQLESKERNISGDQNRAKKRVNFGPAFITGTQTWLQIYPDTFAPHANKFAISTKKNLHNSLLCLQLVSVAKK